MPLKQYEQLVADKDEELREMSLSRQPQIANRLMQLMNDPAERDADIIEDYLEANYLEDVEAHGNTELATAYWSEVGKLVGLSWDALLKGADGNQGAVIEDAKNVVFSAAQAQAQSESGIAQKALEVGLETIAERERAVDKLTAEERRKLRYNVKGVIRDRKKAKDGSR